MTPTSAVSGSTAARHVTVSISQISVFVVKLINTTRGHAYKTQESYAIAKMTARCAFVVLLCNIDAVYRYDPAIMVDPAT